MKVSRAEVEKNRERILEEAGRLFREHGVAGVSVSDVMRAAGLTHGAFYGYFASKEELAARACEHALRSTLAKFRTRPSGELSLESFTRDYLSTTHRDAPGAGCVLAALAGETARLDEGELKTVFAEGAREYLELLADLEQAPDPAESRRRALARLSALVGALVLSRAVDDEHLSSELLGAVRAETAPERPKRSARTAKSTK
ncbi:MAG: TetR family transcriptional regulator [Labilithrix sp.]|nr:TetR family transcriptional regulator [Labilithrix sp.]